MSVIQRLNHFIYRVVKCKAVITQNYVDDLDLDEEGVGEVLLDENAVAAMPRPGTSLAQTGLPNVEDQSVRPVSRSGRPLSGFVRPGTNCRPISSAANLKEALQSSRGVGHSTSRPLTTFGREIRLRTASIVDTGALVDVGKLNLKKYAQRTGIAMILFEYLLYVEHNIGKALELCVEANQACKFDDWFWKNRLGKCYIKLGLLRDAEKHFRSSLKVQPTVGTYLELSNVYIRLDMPNSSMDLLEEASSKFTTDPHILLGIARLNDQLNHQDAALKIYRQVLSLDASNIESLASLGAHYFYSDQPELSIRYYRRLLQMGVKSSELWNNLGLCCFYSAQYDIALSCMDHALSMADDDNMSDVWYNIGHIGVALGDLGLSYQAFKVAVSVDSNHSEALNNIAVLETRRMKIDLARICLSSSVVGGPHLFEPMFNSALMAYRAGDFQDAYLYISKAIKVCPGHSESKELLNVLKNQFALST